MTDTMRKRRNKLVYRNRLGKRLSDGRGVPSSVEIGGKVLALSREDQAFVLATWRDAYEAKYAAVQRRDGTTVNLPEATTAIVPTTAMPATIAWSPNVVADGAIDNKDLMWVIAHWGMSDGVGGTVGVQHLLAVISAWGPVTPPTVPMVDSPPISLHAGDQSIANKRISGQTGIVGDNATHVGNLSVANCEIRSTNYGIYCGDVDEINLANVAIFCDPNGGDSYSIRACVNRAFSSTDCEFHSGIKAFRIPECHGGTHKRFKITGDRAMLGGGYANEWQSPGTFENVAFEDGEIDVNSVEIYNATHNVSFTRVNFAGTGHISIQFGAHHITFAGCTNQPEIKYFDANGNRYTPTAAQLSARGISIT